MTQELLPTRRRPIAASIIASLIAMILVSAEPFAASAATPDISAADLDRTVVMISVDGLCGYYLDDPLAELPTIRQIAAEGVRATAMKVSNPTVTWTNHVTLSPELRRHDMA